MTDPNGIPTPPYQAPPSPDSTERMYGMLCHLLALAGFWFPLGGSIVGPLILWMIKKDESKFIDEAGKESVNFQITVLIAMAVSLLLAFVLIGFFLMALVGVAALVFVIIASVETYNGKTYRYPLTLRLIK